jgi:hypothetical protein
MKVEVFDLVPEEIDVDDFMARMSESMRNDLERESGDARQALVLSMGYPSGTKKVIKLDGVPIVLFGAAVVPTMGDAAEIWKVETAEHEKARTSYFRILKRCFEEWGMKYGALRGYINAEFGAMLKGMEHAGYRLTYLGPEYGDYVEVFKSWDSR